MDPQIWDTDEDKLYKNNINVQVQVISLPEEE